MSQTDKIGQTVLETVAQKCKSVSVLQMFEEADNHVAHDAPTMVPPDHLLFHENPDASVDQKQTCDKVNVIICPLNG